MSDDDLEQRIRTALRADAENARISPHAWPRVSARLASGDPDARPRSHRGRSIGLAVAGVAALATVGAIVGPQLLSGPTGEPAERGSLLTSQSPGPSVRHSPKPLPRPRTLGGVKIGSEASVGLVLSPSGGGATVKLGVYYDSDVSLESPLDQVEVATVAKPTDKVGVCQFRVVNGRTKTVTVSVAPAGAACTKPVTYAIGSTQLTRTS